MDRFLELQSFRAVVEKGSFVRAAESLGGSKAAVSRRVAELEARVGVRLLNRTTRKVSLTEEGRIFNERAGELLEGLRQAEEELASRGAAVSGALRISAPVSYGMETLAPLWAGFMRKHPEVRLEVELSDRVVDLVEEGFDLAVRIGRLADSGLVARRVAQERLRLVAAPGWAERHGSPRRPKDLTGKPAAIYTLGAFAGDWEFEGPSGEKESGRVEAVAKSNAGDVCAALARSGVCAALQPSFVVEKDLRSGALVELLPGWKGRELGVHAVCPSRKHMAPRVRAMMDYLAEALGGAQRG